MHVSIRTRILGGTIFLVTFSVGVSGFLSYNHIRRVIQEQSILASRIQLSQVSAQLKKLQDQIQKASVAIVSDQEIQNRSPAVAPSPDDGNYFKKRAQRQRLSDFVVLNDFLVNATVIRSDGDIDSNNSGFDDYLQAYQKAPWYQSFAALGHQSGFTTPHDFFYLARTIPVFSYVVSYRPPGGVAEQNFKLILDIRYSELESIFRPLSDEFEHLILTDAQGSLLWPLPAGTSQGLRGFPAVGNEAETEWTITLVDKTLNDGWTQTAVISKSKLFAKIDKILTFDILVVLGSIVFILAVFLPLGLRVTQPIGKLTKAMDRVSRGDLSVRLSIFSHDEFQVLADGFNAMVDRLRLSIEATLSHERQERQMHIALLMAQVNPHFLYNTLNTVIYLAQEEGNPRVTAIAQALISILQDTIRPGPEVFFSTVRQERQIVKQYTVIQQLRYPGLFRVIWKTGKGLLDVPIPRLMIQPLVENALFHGICPTDRPGTIRITVTANSSYLTVAVEDDGQGMSQDILQRVLHSERKSTKTDQITQIGLANIHDRLRFHFGVDATMHLSSAIGRGTRVEIILPILDRIGS